MWLLNLSVSTVAGNGRAEARMTHRFASTLVIAASIIAAVRIAGTRVSRPQTNDSRCDI